MTLEASVQLVIGRDDDVAQPAGEPSMIRTALLRLWNRLAAAVVGEVPPVIAACEFDCRREQCPADAWERCERRLLQAAAQDVERRPSR